MIPISRSLHDGLPLIPSKGNTENEIHSWRPVGLLHPRQKPLADHDAYDLYGVYAPVLCGASRNRSFHSWPIRDARKRASRPPQTSVPSLVELNYESAETKVRDSNLNIRILAHRYDVPNEPCTIIFQTPQAGERVSYGTFVGVVVSNREGDKAKQCSSH